MFPVVPSLKYIGDSTKDAMGYHVSHNQQLTHLETLVTEVRTTVQALGDVCEVLRGPHWQSGVDINGGSGRGQRAE